MGSASPWYDTSWIYSYKGRPMASWLLMISHLAHFDYWPRREFWVWSEKFQDYAIETPLKKSSSAEGYHDVRIDLKPDDGISAINFVLKVLTFLQLEIEDFSSGIEYAVELRTFWSKPLQKKIHYFSFFPIWVVLWCRMRKLVLGINTKEEISRFLWSTTLRRMLI